MSQTNEVWRVRGLMGDWWEVLGVNVSEHLRWERPSVSYEHRHGGLRTRHRETSTPELGWGFLLRLIVDEANISINSSQSHDTIKTLFVDYDGGLVMRSQAELVSVTNSNLTWRQVSPALAVMGEYTSKCEGSHYREFWLKWVKEGLWGPTKLSKTSFSKLKSAPKWVK